MNDTELNALIEEAQENAKYLHEEFDGASYTFSKMAENLDEAAAALVQLRDERDAARADGWDEAMTEAGNVCQRIQDDPEFSESGPGVVAAKIVLRATGRNPYRAARVGRDTAEVAS